MSIENKKTYKIKGKSKYFKDKYGTSNPEFRVEGTDKEVWGKSWMFMDGNPTALLYAMRSGADGIGFNGTVYYGKIGNTGELVHESELV